MPAPGGPAPAEEEGESMECPRCAREIVPDRLFCIWCDAFIPKPAAGVKASLVRRLLATVVDPLLGYIVFTVTLQIASGWSRSPFDDSPLWFAQVASIAYMAIGLLLMRRGLTPGKWLLGERVVHKMTGEPAGFWRMVLREVVGKAVSGIFFGLGYLWAIWDRDAQAWHDKIADTVVLKEERPAPLTPARSGFRPGTSTP
ncbi:MAG: RDD family protein [Candidatus Tectomicrobia bacterium]|uniref:RDD family protein n=1 Tax=Tectimicrobiota bacterium TaxID=2528274 RepID=A0A932HZE3_UNCTE|nr:RDD family protein [Candidatus Tectomicrobia bacterium]